MFKNLRIGQRILWGAGSALVVVIGILMLVNATRMESLLHDMEETTLKSHVTAVEKAMESEARLAETLSALVASMPQVQEAFANDDRETLKSMFVSGFADLKSQYAASQFQFHKPPAISYLRVHQPDKFGDDLSSFRFTVVETNESRRPTVGLELGVAGLGIRGVVPMVYQNQHIGSVEFGMSFGGPFFESFKKRHGVDVALHFPDGAKFKQFATTIAGKTYLNDGEMTSALKGAPQMKYEGAGDKRPMAVYASAVNDYSGKPIAVLEVAMDRSGFVDNLAAARNVSLLVGLVALLVCLLGARFIATSIADPLQQAVGTLRSIADGDLRAESRGQFAAHEMGQLMSTTYGMAKSLRSDMGQISQSSSALSAEAGQLAMTAEQASADVRKQEDQLSQIAAAINQMSTSVQEVATNAALVVEATQETDRESAHGREVVANTILTIESLAQEVSRVAEAIAQLAARSQNIGGVIDVINDIADQTNLLALNAAIEAARAGEQGRGFAVVADEVRTLAQRTQKSTYEIRQMIEQLQQGAAEAVRAMETGRGTVDRTVSEAANAGETLGAIAASVSKIMSMNNHIATAAEEQSTVTEDISRRVEEIRIVAQETAKSSNVTAESSEKLAALADQLQSTVRRFKI